MKILLLNNYFPPEIGAASHLYYYLAKALRDRGHTITILTGVPRYNIDVEIYKEYSSKGKVYEELFEGLRVIRVRLPYVERSRFLRRGIEHFEIAYKLFKFGKRVLKNQDVTLVYSPPLTLYWTAEKIRNMFGAPYILNVQDLFPQAAIDIGILRNPILIRFFRWLEKRAYRSADLITVHSPGNRKHILKIVKDDSKVIVVENWIDENEIPPGPKDNDFSRKHNIADKFVVSFAGTLGVSQDIEVILKAAKKLLKYEEIIFIIVGDGVQKNWAIKIAKEENLKNVKFIPTVPKETYPMVLWSSDVSLATLKKDVKTPVIPSKILSIMSAGKPVIAVMNTSSDASKLIKNAECGFVIPAGDYKKLAEVILKLYKNRSLLKKLGENGRKYVLEHLSVKKAAEIYENLFEKLLRNLRR